MAVTRYVHTAFWNDSFNLTLTPEEKYFFLYFLTNPHSKQCGVYELPRRTIEFETGYNSDTVSKLINRFRDYGKLDYDDATNEIIILNWPKFNCPNSTPVHKCIERELKSIKNNDFHDKILAQLIRYGYPLHTTYRLYTGKELKGTELNLKERTEPPSAESESQNLLEKSLTSTPKGSAHALAQSLAAKHRVTE